MIVVFTFPVVIHDQVHTGFCVAVNSAAVLYDSAGKGLKKIQENLTAAQLSAALSF